MALETPIPPVPSAPEARRRQPPTSPRMSSPRQVGWRSSDILRGAALVLGVWLAMKLLWVAYPILFVAFLGTLFGLAVARSADFLERLHIPRGFGAALTVFAFVGLLVGLGFWVGPTLREQLTELRTAVPQSLNQVEGWLSRRGVMVSELMPGDPAQGASQGAQQAPAGAGVGVQPSRGPAEQPQGAQRTGPPRAGGAQAQETGGSVAETGSAGGQLSQMSDSLSGQLGAISSYLFSFLSSTLAVLTGLFLILVLSIYIGANPGLYKRGMLHLIPRESRPRASQVLSAVGMTLQRWLGAQLIAMAVIAVVTTIGLWALGVKGALALGLIAGLLEFIPMVGPLLSAVPAVAMGFLDSPQKALFVALLYTGIQLMENHILIPIVMKEGVDLPPVLTILGIAVMSIVFGFLGMLVAVPILAAILVAVKLLYVEDVMGDDVKTVLDS
jgi:predicted PurR-regulated permease PerM